MKLKIKVKLENGVKLPKLSSKGDWIDLRAKETVTFEKPTVVSSKKEKSVTVHDCFIKLGVAMQLPEGFEAILLPRSSAYNKYRIIMANSMGVIDNSYCGDEDEWMFHAIALEDGFIERGERFCQFRIQLSQNATIWQKIKWLLSNKIEFIQVDSLYNSTRGGFGSTGVQ